MDSEFKALEGFALGEYVLDELVGAGGQAVVFKSHVPELDSTFALKVFGLFGNALAGVRQGFDEAKKLSRLRHQGVVGFFPPVLAELDLAGTLRTVLGLPMDFSSLGSCDRHPPFKARPFADQDIRAVIALLDGLREIHAQAIIHNDIKPANILQFSERIDGDERLSLRIADFGIAKVMSAFGPVGPSAMSPQFMAPERLDHTSTESSDVYSMGASLYFMVTGKLPINATDEGLDAWQEAHLNQPRPNACKDNIHCPPRLALLMIRMMAPDPTARPAIADCSSELRQLAESLRANVFGFSIPPLLKAVLTSDDFPIVHRPTFTGIFRPAVHEACGTQLFIFRIGMTHSTFSQYKRLIEACATNLSDTYRFYEMWGTYDVTILAWTPVDTAEVIRDKLKSDFAPSQVEMYAGLRVYDVVSSDAAPLWAPDPVAALAVQEGVTLDGLDPNAYLCGSFETDASADDIRGLTYVEYIDHHRLDHFARTTIIESVRQRMTELGAKRELDGTPCFKSIRVVQLSEDAKPTVLVVEYVARKFKHLAEVPSRIIALGENAVKTASFLATGRIMIESDKLPF